MTAESVDVVVTSPPYNQGVAYSRYNDRVPRETFLAWLGEVFAELHRVLKPNGSFFLNINGSGTKDDFTLPYAIIDRVLATGFTPQNHIVWVKAITVEDVIRGHCKPVNSSAYLTRMHETILHLTKTGQVPLDKLGIGVPYADKSNIARRSHAQDLRDRGNTWFIDYDTVQSRSEKYDHPAGFPVELPTWCIKLHGVRPDLVVLDPFLGAGTTLVAAETLGCRGIGTEIDPKYVATVVQRLKAMVPVEVKPQHSRIGPSRAALVWHCAGSVQAEDEAGRPPAGEAAERGTALHAIAETLLRDGKDTTGAPVEVAAYINEVRRLAATTGTVPLIEHRLDLSHHHPELFGTADCVIVDLDRGVLTVTDFKSGFHHVAADVLQLKLYAGMAFLRLSLADAQRIHWITTTVIQPNGGGEPVRRETHRVADILQTLSDYVDRAHLATGSKNPPRTAGPWCTGHFCAARGACPAFRGLALREARSVFVAEEGDGRSPLGKWTMNDNIRSSTRLVLRGVRLAYASGLYVPKAFEQGQQPKYGCTCLLRPGHPAVDEIEDALAAAAGAKWGDKKNWPKRLRGLNYEPVPKSVADFGKLQTGDIDELWSFVRASSLDPPAIVGPNVDEVVGGDLRRECYSGRYANVSINAYAYERQTGSGVTLGLNSVQLTRHADQLGAGRPKPEEDFDPEPLDADNDNDGEEDDELLVHRPRRR
jgi:site-specific DNA-methyltransferase (adenine-specific)